LDNFLPSAKLADCSIPPPQLGREVAAKMLVVDFAPPVLNPKTRNKRHEEDVGAEDICDGGDLTGRGTGLEY
jgi:hypothetical protein